MDQRRYMFFVLLTMVFFLIWSRIAPQLFPEQFPKPKKDIVAAEKDNVDEDALLENKEAPDLVSGESDTGEPEVEKPKPEEAPVEVEKVELKKFDNQQILLGQEGFEAGFFVQAQVNTQGASIDWVQLTDERYTTLDRKEQLKVVGNPMTLEDGKRVPKTFEMSVLQIDSQLEEFETSLAEVDWEILKQDADSITFRYPSPKGDLEVLKTYRIEKGEEKKRDESPNGYMINMEIVIRNTSKKTIETAYRLQGPVGIPLENADNTRSFREIDIATIEDPRDPTDLTIIHLTAAALVKQVKKAKNDDGNPVVSWREPIHYAGMDVQFFTALLLPDRPDGDQLDPYFESVQPQLLLKTEKPAQSHISLTLDSQKQKIKPGKEVVHSFKTYFGPKRKQLLEPILAGDVVRLGWFSLIAKAMLKVLDFFHTFVGLPYAFAIILLTVVVRGMMFPISKKQAIESEKMKILAPKLKEIQEKHKDKPEEFAKAYRAFQKKYNYHPMVGCLPALLQLPIFYGLYTSLYNAVDLRLAEFLWINNLAAPDALVEFGFTIPWLGFTTLNLLPLVTVCLFVAQQKMFTPPPTSEEQAMTYKMMNYMMIFMGFMFYRVPAGLCLYFISSSIWGMCERTLLKKNVNADGTVDEPDEPPPTTKPKDEPPKPDKPPGFLERLRQAADEAQQASHGAANERKYSKQRKDKKKKR